MSGLCHRTNKKLYVFVSYFYNFIHSFVPTHNQSYTIQTPLTFHQNCDLLRALRDARNARIALELASCQQLQRVLRGHLGRVCFARVRHEYDLRLREWREAIVVQAAFRGMGGRRRVAYLRWLAAREWAIKCALVIQSAWRANRARYRADVTRSLRDLRRTQFAAAREIQRCWRGKLGRERAARRKLLMAELQQRERAAMTMCRVFRGHKGRER